MEYLKDTKSSFDELVSRFKEELSAIRTNRPTPKLIENIKVSYGESILPLNQLASISVEPPRNLVVNPWDKDSIPGIVKAIELASIGVGASAQGIVVRVTLPELTIERQEELAKVIRNSAEQTRIKMRMRRDETQKRITKEPDEDIRFKNKNELQKMVDSFNSTIDESVDIKLKEILG